MLTDASSSRVRGVSFRQQQRQQLPRSLDGNDNRAAKKGKKKSDSPTTSPTKQGDEPAAKKDTTNPPSQSPTTATKKGATTPEETCQTANECADCQMAALAVHKVDSGKSCRWIKSDTNTTTCQIHDADPQFNIVTMCDAPAAHPNANAATPPPTTSPTTSPTSSPTTSPTRSPVKPTPQPVVAETPRPTPKPVTPEPSKAEPFSDDDDDDDDNTPTKSPTKATPADTDPPTQKPAKKPWDERNNDDTMPLEDESGLFDDPSVQAVAGVTLVVMLMILWTRCCRSPPIVAADGTAKGEDTRSLLGARTHPGTTATAEEDDDEWGWEDDNDDDNNSGDVEMSHNKLRERSPSPPQRGLKLSSPPTSGNSRTKGLATNRTSPPPARAGLSLSKPKAKPLAAKKKPNSDDFFSEMGLSSSNQPKFATKPKPTTTSSKRLGAVSLPVGKDDADDWGNDDDLDDLLND